MALFPMLLCFLNRMYTSYNFIIGWTRERKEKLVISFSTFDYFSNFLATEHGITLLHRLNGNHILFPHLLCPIYEVNAIDFYIISDRLVNV